jgi:hypothetical protein
LVSWVCTAPSGYLLRPPSVREMDILLFVAGLSRFIVFGNFLYRASVNLVDCCAVFPVFPRSCLCTVAIWTARLPLCDDSKYRSNSTRVRHGFASFSLTPETALQGPLQPSGAAAGTSFSTDLASLLPGTKPISRSWRPRLGRGRVEPGFGPVARGREVKVGRRISSRSCFRQLQRSRYRQGVAVR